jgi:hypothetical protein
MENNCLLHVLYKYINNIFLYKICKEIVKLSHMLYAIDVQEMYLEETT